MSVSALARSVSVGEALVFLRLPVDDRLPDLIAQQRFRPVYLVFACILTAVLTGLALSSELALPVNDKILHALGNGLFTATVYPVFLPSSSPSWAKHLPLLASSLAGGLLMGVGSEFAQATLSRRKFDWGDIVSNLVGFALALSLSHRFARPWLTDIQRSELDSADQPEEARGLVS